MPIIKSAKKALRQSKKRRAKNIKRKKAMKDIVKKVKKDPNFLSQAYKTIDKAAKAGTIKKRAASRKKSRLTKLINKATKK